MARLFISALHKSSGKTILTSGICAALKAGGLSVQPFKKGPDYIDPMWLALASGRPCFNLDFHVMSERQILDCQGTRAADADISIVEGNKGLHDGVRTDGRDSNAALAKLTASPVVLIADASGITRSIAPMLNGFHHFDPDVQVSGVILNKVGGPRHEGKLTAAIETYCDLPLLGCVRRTAEASLDERHIGLTPAAESAEAGALVNAWRDVVTDGINLDALTRAAKSAQPGPAARALPELTNTRDVTIAVAAGKAFSFYYPDDIENLRRNGAHIINFDPINDEVLPEADGLFIGGGFPEYHLEALERNVRLRQRIQAAAGQGLPVYAECGGLMYLASSIEHGGRHHEMVGAIPGTIQMHRRPQGRGYATLCRTNEHPFGTSGQSLPAHEFHHSSISGLPPQTRFAYKVERGFGIDGEHDGIVINNLLASYAHQRDVSGAGWTKAFVNFVRTHKQRHASKTMLAQEVNT